VLATLRPQAFGKRSPHRIADPIVEPLWVGVRSLAAVDPSGAILTDDSGVPIEDQPDIVSALAAASRSGGLVLDGFLSKQAVGDGTGVTVVTDVVPSLGSSVGHFFLGSRRNRRAEAERERAELREAETFGPDDTIGYVAIDLLWLDGESLLDVPLLERRRLLDGVLADSDIVRRGTFVRPPIGNWVRSWRAQGFMGLTFKAANSRYEPGAVNDEWTTAPMPR
jgi:hypothetical protein